MFYLAAGNSSRFGSNKLLAALKGRPVFLWGLETLSMVQARRQNCDLTVISRSPVILEEARLRGFAAVESPLSGNGISHTIRAGLEAAGPLDPGDFLLFVLADQPWLHADTLTRMLDAAVPGCLAATASFEGQPGSPTLFSAALAGELMDLEGDQGGRAVLRRYPDRVVTVEAGSARELKDIDRPGDLHN